MHVFEQNRRIVRHRARVPATLWNNTHLNRLFVSVGNAIRHHNAAGVGSNTCCITQNYASLLLAGWFGFVWLADWFVRLCPRRIRLNDADVEGLCVCFVLPAGRYGDPHIYFQVGTCCRQSFAISAFRMFYLPIKFEPSSFILTESQRHWMLYINTADHNVEFWYTNVYHCTVFPVR